MVIPNIGESGMSDNNYLEFCRKNSNSKFTVMVHLKNVIKEDIHDIKNAGVDAVRVIFSKADAALAYPSIEGSLPIKRFDHSSFTILTASVFSSSFFAKVVLPAEPFHLRNFKESSITNGMEI